jgi:hypothetical protein
MYPFGDVFSGMKLKKKVLRSKKKKKKIISVESSRANLKIANNLEGFFIVLPFTKYNPKGQGTFFLFCLEN